MHTATTYSISQMAAEFGVTLRTLRFYEGRGLLSPARDGMARVYSEADRARFRKIHTWAGRASRSPRSRLRWRTAVSIGPRSSSRSRICAGGATRPTGRSPRSSSR